MKFTVAYYSRHGKHKQKCEDSILIGNEVTNEKEGIIELESPCFICLCDGVGGYAGGQEASLFVANELSTADIPCSVEDIKELFIDINNRLIKKAQSTTDHKRMGTTATALFITNDSFYVAHIGNTRLYTKQDASISQITLDHTMYQWFNDHHLKLFASDRNRDVIYGGLGGNNPKGIKPLVVKQLSNSQISNTFLLTSDGVHELLSKEEIEEILNDDIPLLDKAEKLCSTALDHGSEDDRSVVIVCVKNKLFYNKTI